MSGSKISTCNRHGESQLCNILMHFFCQTYCFVANDHTAHALLGQPLNVGQGAARIFGPASAGMA